MSFQLSDYVPEDNLYRRLKSLIDFSFLYKRTADYYGREGQKSVDPVVFMKLMLVGYLENINSDRRIISFSKMRLDILYFLGYDLDEELPWHSTLSRTRQLYGEEVFTEVFRTVLKQCIDKGMVAGKRQAVDSVYVKANASLDSMVERGVLDDAIAYSKELIANEQEQQAPIVDIEGDCKMDKDDGTKPTNKSHYSPTDPDAKMAVKPGKVTTLNYLGQVSVDPAEHVITHIESFKSDLRDSDCLPQFTQNMLNNFDGTGIHVEELIADTGYSSGKALKFLEENNITGFIPNRPQFKGDKPGFIYNKEGNYYTCPNNEKLIYKGTNKTKDGVYNKEYRASRRLCNKCSFKGKCPVYGKYTSLLRETIDKEYYERMHERMQTRKAKKLMKLRQSTVEPVIGTLINYMGMSRVNTKGLPLANKCMTMAAVAYNIKKLLKYQSLLVQAKAQQLKNGLIKSIQCLLSLYRAITYFPFSFARS